jgi:hypothetical protein
MPQERRSTTLAPEDWQRLDDLAAATGSVATAGQTAGEPTWRALLRRVVRNDRLMEIIAAELKAADELTDKGRNDPAA